MIKTNENFNELYASPLLASGISVTGNEIIAIASDTTHPDVNLPIFDLNNTSDIATFILTKVELL